MSGQEGVHCMINTTLTTENHYRLNVAKINIQDTTVLSTYIHVGVTTLQPTRLTLNSECILF